MSRRVSLPGADELFRNTATLSAVPSSRENAEEITQTPAAAVTAKNSVRQTNSATHLAPPLAINSRARRR